MPGTEEAPSQQNIEDVEEGESKDRECCLAGYMKVDIILLTTFALIFLFVVGACVFFGPDRVLEACLSFLIPKKPAWEHALVIGFLIGFGMVFPFPVVWFLMLLAGLNYGFWYGFVIILIPQPIGLSFAYLIGTNLCRQPIRHCLLGGNYPRAQKVMEVMEAQKDMYWALMCFRFLPVPFAIRNYTPTIMQVSWPMYILTSFPHCVWQAILFASLGAMFKDAASIARDEGRWDWNSLRWQEGLIFIGSIIGGVGCAIYACRVYYRAAPNSESQEGSLFSQDPAGLAPARRAPPGDPEEAEEPSPICCCCDRKQMGLRGGLCWAYFGFILVVAIIIGVCSWKYGANEVSMYLIHLLPDNPDAKTAVVLVLVVIATQVLLIPFRAIPLLLVGLFFGIWPGMAYLFVAFYVILMTCLAIGQAMGKPAVQECMQEEGWSDIRRFINLVEDDAHSMKLLVLYPFLLQPDLARYYFPSILAVPVWKFAVCYLPWCLWVSFVYSSLGAAFQDTVELSKRADHIKFEKLRWQQVAPVAIAVFITPFICWYACREYRKKLAAEESRPIRST